MNITQEYRVKFDNYARKVRAEPQKPRDYNLAAENFEESHRCCIIIVHTLTLVNLSSFLVVLKGIETIGS